MTPFKHFCIATDFAVFTGAIPLIDPNWELLPIHFLVDPGEKYDWHTDQPPCQLPSLDGQLHVLSQYVEVLSLPLPASMVPSPPVTPVTGEVVNGSGLGGGNGVHRSVSNESDEGKGDKKKNRQLQAVSKSFGSLGKSLGKNIKKMGTLGKDKDKKKVKTPPAVAVANNGLSINSDVLSDRQHVLCSRLLYKRMAYQDEIVRNYLESAEVRFRSEQEAQKLQQQESVNSKPVECINQGCKGKATADTSYLCKGCFEKQKMVESNRDRSEGEQYSRGGEEGEGMAASLGLSPMHINNVAAAGVNSSPAFTRHDTLITTGKSKFYTLPAEEHAVVPPNNRLRPQQAPPHINSSASTVARPTKVELSRSSFYDSSMTNSSLPPPPHNPPPRYVNNLKSTTVKKGTVAQEIQPSQALAANFMSDKQFNSVNLLRSNESAPPKTTNKTLDYTDTHYKLNVNLDSPPSHNSKTQAATQKCRTPNCDFFGTGDTDFLCSACYKKKHSELLKQAEFAQKQTNL